MHKDEGESQENSHQPAAQEEEAWIRRGRQHPPPLGLTCFPRAPVRDPTPYCSSQGGHHILQCPPRNARPAGATNKTQGSPAPRFSALPQAECERNVGPGSLTLQTHNSKAASQYRPVKCHNHPFPRTRRSNELTRRSSKSYSY